MTAGSEQIVKAYEILSLTPEQIAKEQELDILSVKACLLQFSSKYKLAVKKESREQSEISCVDSQSCEMSNKIGFTEVQEQMALDVIADLAAYSEDERVQIKAATFIRDDRQGRRDFASKFGSLNINVITFNEQLKKAWQIVQEAKKPKEIIDV
jgi:hypothetical protein